MFGVFEGKIFLVFEVLDARGAGWNAVGEAEADGGRERSLFVKDLA